MPSTSATSWMRVCQSDFDEELPAGRHGRTVGPRPSDGLMPLGSPPLCSEKIDAIRRWIAAGAPP